MFGKGEELFMAHWITKAPDFDQAVSVQIPGHEFTDEELRQGILIIVPNRANSIAGRVKPQERIEDAIPVAIEVDEALYFEEEELGSPPIFGQTEEEAKARF